MFTVFNIQNFFSKEIKNKIKLKKLKTKRNLKR